MSDAPAQSPEFKKAAEDVTKLKKEASNDDKKRLYGLYKAGTEPAGSWTPDPKTAPSSWNIFAYGKWEGRKQVYEEGLSPEEAQAKYIELVNKLIETIGLKD